MRNKRRKVAVLGIVEALKGLDCDSARSKVTDLDQQADRLQQRLSRARQVEQLQTSSLNALLHAMPTFDPVVYRSGVASVHAAQRQSRAIEEEHLTLSDELSLAREQLLQATAGHEIIKKEYRKSKGKLSRALKQQAEHAGEDAFVARQRSSHGSFNFLA